MSDARAGIASLTVNGLNLDVAGDLKCDPSSIKNDILVGQSGLQGYKTMPKAGSIEAKIRDNAGLSVTAFNGMVGATVVGIMASGKRYSGANLVQTSDNLQVDTMEGTFELKFEGVVEEN